VGGSALSILRPLAIVIGTYVYVGEVSMEGSDDGSVGGNRVRAGDELKG
jgi:hypothetical protein